MIHFCLWLALLTTPQSTHYRDFVKNVTYSESEDFGSFMHRVALQYIGTPYVEKTLDQNETEELVVNFEGMDCVTFVETTFALSLSIADEKTFANYTGHLESMRYRHGKRNGYASRLHYFTEWGMDNTARHKVMDITKSLGGKPINRPINFISSHTSAYPLLVEADIPVIKKAEARISNAKRYYIPKDQVAHIEGRLNSGDIIAITTNITGLDVLHTGIASRKGSRCHLLHASSKGGAVLLSKVTLAEYLAQSPSRTGIIIYRPVEPKKRL